MGGLSPSADTLRMIEEISKEDDSKLQDGFQDHDTCSGKSYFSFKKSTIFVTNCFKGGANECETAAEIYQCGREAAPAITDAIYTQSMGSFVVVGCTFFCNINMLILKKNRAAKSTDALYWHFLA